MVRIHTYARWSRSAVINHLSHCQSSKELTKIIEFFLIEFYIIYRIGKTFLWQKSIRACYLLCKKPGWYYSAKKAQVIEGIFKLTPIHASVISQILWIRWISFSFRKNSNDHRHLYFQFTKLNLHHVIAHFICKWDSKGQSQHDLPVQTSLSK